MYASITKCKGSFCLLCKMRISKVKPKEQLMNFVPKILFIEFCCDSSFLILSDTIPFCHPQSLLHDPNPNSPANNEAAQLYRENRREYEKKVAAIVQESWNDDEEEGEEEDDGEESKAGSQHCNKSEGTATSYSKKKKESRCQLLFVSLVVNYKLHTLRHFRIYFLENLTGQQWRKSDHILILIFIVGASVYLFQLYLNDKIIFSHSLTC